MVSFFVFWTTLLFHIWPPTLYWSDEMVFWRQSTDEMEVLEPSNSLHVVDLHIDLDSSGSAN